MRWREGWIFPVSYCMLGGLVLLLVFGLFGGGANLEAGLEG